MNYFNPYTNAAMVLSENAQDVNQWTAETSRIYTVLEDVNSPVTQKFQEKMFKSVMNKAHIDFGDIPKSAGNIKNYSGYNTMMDTLNTIQKLAEEEKANFVIMYVNIVKEAIKNIELLSSTFERGFSTKTEYVAMEYDVYVYFCVEATTALIYAFVDVMKAPDKQLNEIKIKNTKLRADEFYFEQLKKFNKVQNNVGMDYRKMLEGMCDKGRDNFVGATAIGVATVIAASTAIVPITREMIYQIYKFRGKVSEHLEIQAKFLELNKACVENNEMMDSKKRKEVLDKQEKLSKLLLNMSDKIRVKSSQSILDSKRELKNDNKMLSIDSIKDEISNSPFEIL